MQMVLQLCARHGRFLLIFGLVGGFALPSIASAMQPWLPAMVAFLIFLNALRIGARSALGSLGAAKETAVTVLALQLVAPLVLLGVLALFGWHTTAFGIAAVLALTAPSISGAPPFSVMVGHAPDHAMRLLILGTAILPLTILPVFWLSPAFENLPEVMAAAGRLTLVLAISVTIGFLIRHLIFGEPSPETLQAFDGLSALTLAIIVIGLMSAVGPALRTDAASLLPWLILVFGLNFGAQIVSHLAGRPAGTSIVAGNRNVALFLVALPPEIIAPLLLFIGCYQIPMYLTPLVMKPLYARYA